MHELNTRDKQAVSGGEVGATHGGDNMSYTGYATGTRFGDCMVGSGGSFPNFALCMLF